MNAGPGKCGGIVTLEDLRDRCVVDEDTGCWLWRGTLSAGVPRVWAFDPERKAWRVMTGARAGWYLSKRGKARQLGKLTVYKVLCTESRCTNPAHMAKGTKAEAGAHLVASGHLRGNPLRAVKNLQNGMRNSKATPELRALILASNEPAAHLAPKLGLDHTTVSYVRQGKRWGGVAGSSVFSTWKQAA
jgi:hypothetical protein